MRCSDPWFVASDACKCLELKDDAGTICRELDEQDKVTLSREEFMGGCFKSGYHLFSRFESSIRRHDHVQALINRGVANDVKFLTSLITWSDR